MSYILAALEKADKERRKKRGLTLETLSDSAAEHRPQRSRRNRILIAIGSLICLLLLGLIWRAMPVPSIQPESASLVTSTTIEAQLDVPAQRPSTDSADPLSALPERLEVEGIIYIESQPERSQVFIEGRGYRAGDFLRENFRIVSIEETAITLSNSDSSRSYPIP